MKLPHRNFLYLTAGAAALPAVSRFAWAQAYPTRPVRVIVPFATVPIPDHVPARVHMAALGRNDLQEEKRCLSSTTRQTPYLNGFR